MRLAVDVRCLQDKYWTGVASYTWNNIKHLAAVPGLQQTFYANSLGNNNLSSELGAWGKVVTRHFPNKIQDLAWRFNMWPGIDQLLGKTNEPDWLWLPNPNFFRVTGARTALTIHDLSFIHFLDFFAPKTRWWYLNFVKNFLKHHLSELALIIAVSENTRQDLLTLYPGVADKVKVVYPGVDQAFFKAPTPSAVNELSKKYKLPENYILSVGTLEPRKNHRLLLEMYQELCSSYKDWPSDLVIVGPPGRGADDLFKYWRTLPDRGRIHFLGYVPKAWQPALYHQASLFLYPSYYEGFGFPVVEAMASGVPAVVSNVSSLPELVGDSAYLLSPWKIGDWVETVYKLINQPADRQRLAKLAQERARKFTWEASVNKLYNLFTDYEYRI